MVPLQRVIVLLLLGIFAIGSDCKVSDELSIALPHGGTMVGKYMTSHKGRGIRAFLGIPFAEPPTGKLRFQPPFPKLPWTGVLEATDGNKMCPQPFGSSIAGDEDCLHVNVYTPLNPRSKDPLPVMFFIHGGGFVMGSGGVTFYPPEYLLDHDVVLVVGNYRLGALGFLSLNSGELPGNNGLKDQHLLLQWVQDNIAAFGGDPRRVTIFGESAGSASVAYHLIAKSSYQLFQKAILQSGTQYAPWAFDHFNQNAINTEKFGAGLGCALSQSNYNLESFLDCMREKNVEEIFQKGFEVFSSLETPFLPNAEASADGFIQKKPEDYKRSIGLDIPVLIGVTSEEGACYTGIIMGSDTDEVWAMMKSQLDFFITQATYSQGSDESKKQRLQKMIKDYYFENDSFGRANMKNVTDFFSDGYFVAAFDQFLENRLVENKNSADTFVYLFSHRGAVSFTDILPALGLPEVKLQEDLGVSHMDELFYLFPMGKNLAQSILPTREDELVQEIVTELWVNFATNGQPSSSALDNVTWRAARSYPLDFLRIGNYGQPGQSLVAMESGLLEERVNLWRQLKSINDKDDSQASSQDRVEL